MRNRSCAALFLLATTLCPLTAIAQGEPTGAYLVDSRNEPVRSGSGLCWHTGAWNPAGATLPCDPDLVPRPVPMAAPAPPPKAAMPAPAPAPAAQKVTLTADAFFGFGKAMFLAADRIKLDELVRKLPDLNLEVILVAGHADRLEAKDKAKGLKLAEQRAAFVKEYLVINGIEPSRIYAEGKAGSQPGKECAKLGKEQAGNNRLVECLATDRRVDLEVVGTAYSTPKPMASYLNCLGLCDKEKSVCGRRAVFLEKLCVAAPGAVPADCRRWRADDAQFECDAALIPCKAHCPPTK